MKIDAATFLTSAKGLEDCPRSTLPEVAFIGRSNVGKSSLVNMLAKQKGLAKVSKKPGATKLLNFFAMNGWWTLVDLPGYGFAQVSKGKQASFNQAVSEYLMGRKQLKLVCVLVDSRSEPLELDLAFLNWLEDCPAPHIIVFTKTDEVPEPTWQRNMDIYRETLAALELRVPDIVPSSSVDRSGRGVLIQRIQSFLPKRPRKGSSSSMQLNWLKKTR